MTGLVLAVALTTLAPNCGTTSHLEYKPAVFWSPTCASPSRRVSALRWEKWTAGSARGRGMVFAEGEVPHRATLTLSQPRTCTTSSGGVYRYFSRVKLRVSVGTDLHHQPGSVQSIRTIAPSQGTCARS